MVKDMSLLQHCRACGSRCCIEKTGGPRFTLKERTLIEGRFGKGSLVEGKGYFVPKKRGDRCGFIEEGLCALEGIKPVDCRIFPLDPIFDAKGQIDFVIDVNCPAAKHLSADFIAEAIRLGIGWMSETEVEAFRHYWSRHKVANPEQRLVRLSEYLRSRPEGFAEDVGGRLPPVQLISRILVGS